MGCGVSRFKKADAGASNDSKPSGDLKIMANSSRPIEVDEDDQDNDAQSSDRNDQLRYPGSPSFRVYCNSDVGRNSKPPRNNTIGNIDDDHVTNNSLFTDQPSDDDKGRTEESGQVKKEGKFRRFTKAILATSHPRKQAHQN